MCNAHNHKPGCTCGWGGEGQRGRNHPGQIHRSPIGADAGSTRHWTIATLDKPVTYETQCWVCGDSVFYHTNGNSDHVLFDKIGWPWELHQCWREHVEDRKRGLLKIEGGLQRAGYDGQNYPAAVQDWGNVEGDEVSGVGFVTEIKITAAPITINVEPTALPCCEAILKQGNFFYRLLFPFRYARCLPNYSIVKFSGKSTSIKGITYLWDPNPEVVFYPSGKTLSLALIDALEKYRQQHSFVKFV